MCSTPDKPPPGRPSFPSPRQSDPRFAQFLQTACLPPGYFRQALADLQQALGDSASAPVMAALQEALEAGHAQRGHIDDLGLLIQDCCKTLHGLLQLLNQSGGALLQPADLHLILVHLDSQLGLACSEVRRL